MTCAKPLKLLFQWLPISAIGFAFTVVFVAERRLQRRLI
jgi:hypothetical protein